jgi:heme a synthase
MSSVLNDSRRAIAIWLLVCCALVFAMVVLGGVTRLTRSGLSIVEWKPIAGAIPPLTEQHWLQEYEKYRQTPEYRKVNLGMGLAEFKSIYWVEFSHRLLGRVIGLAFLLPFLYFLARRRVDRPLAYKLGALFVLGALQGALGWYMVASGLVDDPRVSPYRLTAHLGLAVLIYGYMLWLALELIDPPPGAVPAAACTLRRYAIGVGALVFVTILAGGFVAGTRAGFVFNTFPLMNGQFIPDGAYASVPWTRDIFENVATVQFHHRLLAYAVVVAAIGLWAHARRVALPAPARAALYGLLGAAGLQVVLGITTLLYVVPTPLAASHQAGALLLLTAAVWLVHSLRSHVPTR